MLSTNWKLSSADLLLPPVDQLPGWNGYEEGEKGLSTKSPQKLQKERREIELTLLASHLEQERLVVQKVIAQYFEFHNSKASKDALSEDEDDLEGTLIVAKAIDRALIELESKEQRGKRKVLRVSLNNSNSSKNGTINVVREYIDVDLRRIAMCVQNINSVSLITRPQVTKLQVAEFLRYEKERLEKALSNPLSTNDEVVQIREQAIYIHRQKAIPFSSKMKKFKIQCSIEFEKEVLQSLPIRILRDSRISKVETVCLLGITLLDKLCTPPTAEEYVMSHAKGQLTSKVWHSLNGTTPTPPSPYMTAAKIAVELFKFGWSVYRMNKPSVAEIYGRLIAYRSKERIPVFDHTSRLRNYCNIASANPCKNM